MSDILVFAGIIVGWVVLNVWVLPLFGIQTCISGGCRVPRVNYAEPHRATRNSANDLDGATCRREAENG